MVDWGEILQFGLCFDRKLFVGLRGSILELRTLTKKSMILKTTYQVMVDVYTKVMIYKNFLDNL